MVALDVHGRPSLGQPWLSKSPSLPELLPPLPLSRAATASGVRVPYLPTPTPSARLDFRLPQKPANARISGLVNVHNSFGMECLQLLNSANDEHSQNSSMVELPLRSGVSEMDRQRKARSSAVAAAIQEITDMSNERQRVLLAAKGTATAAEDRAGGAAAKPRQEAEAGRSKREGTSKAVEEQKRQREAKSALGRVEARLFEMRENHAARMDLERRVVDWKQARADGKLERRDFIRENRVLTRTLSFDGVMEARGPSGALAQQRALKMEHVQQRLASLEEEREMVRIAREEAFLASMALSRAMSPREMTMGSRAMTPAAAPPSTANSLSRSRSSTAVGGSRSDAAALKGMGPRERAAAAKLDYDRRCRWTALVMLAARASHSLDQLVWERNNRDANKDASTAATSLQRKYRNKTMRRQLELLHKSSQCLKKNVAAFAFRWRLRKKVRSADIQEHMR